MWNVWYFLNIIIDLIKWNNVYARKFFDVFSWKLWLLIHLYEWFSNSNYLLILKDIIENYRKMEIDLMGDWNSQRAFITY